MNTTTRIVVAILLSLLSLGFFLPTSIALFRNHPKTVSIVLWNTLGMLLLGLGWLVALVISLVDSPQPVVVQVISSGDNNGKQ